MKVAYFLGALNRGGMETLLLDILSRANTASYQIVCIYREEGGISDAFKATGVPLFKMTPRRGMDLSYILRLRRLLCREKVDIVHAQHSLEACYAWLATRGCGIKIIQTFHGYDYHQTAKGRFFMKWMIRHADLNIFVSEVQKSYYEKKYHFPPNRSQVVYNGIDFAKFEQRGRGETFESPGLLIGSVGNFVPGRDQITICRFLVLLKKTGIPFRFLFAGRKDSRYPHLYDECVRFCETEGLQEEVCFLGTRSDVPSLLAQWDAFIYSTEHDTFGIAVIEAIAAGIPVFVNDWEVMREVTEEGRLAVLYKTKEVERLLSFFLDFYAHPEEYREKAQKAALHIKEKYGIEKHMEELSKRYAYLLGTGNKTC
ncbi:glycosyltransferase family 4 protein [uncultured Sanguibacteroides sp.]|uniref:glycosyltransferase family 4 protein n=1 Tax=uncultured Sanguibacteroides sp. TaxID=1635151 RepID=UPI0025EBE5DD|nr:glycosyltransferase family 4 protein [uncultured Sanguibacteroides sp.]